MANAVLHRVWEHSTLRGAARCVILLLADVADQRGIAYPGKPYIAKMIRESDDYTDKLIDKVVESGEVARIAGRGRGHVTRFAVLVGLSEDEQAALKEVLQDPFSIPQKGQKRTPIPSDKRGKVVARKGVLQSDKRGTLSDTNNRTNGATEWPKPRIVKNEIHHDPRSDPPPTPTRASLLGGGDGDDFYLELRKRKVGQAKARQIAGMGCDSARILALIDNRPNASDPNSLGRLIIDILDGVAFEQSRAVAQPQTATRANLPETTVAPAEVLRQLRERR
jgi:hypothetical protein